MQILVKFGDNDFGKTLKAFGDLLLKYIPDWEYAEVTKPQILELWDECIYGMYLMAQNQGWDSQTLDTRNYLRISLKDIFLNQEAVDYMNNNQGMWNHSWVFVDTDHATCCLV